MYKSMKYVVVLTCVLMFTGCMVVVKDEHRAPPAPDPQCAVAADTIAQIDAAGKMSFDSDKESAYKAIARRNHLCDAPQVHLVMAVFRELSFENSKESVLMTLIGNPEFSSAGERAILDRIDGLHFDSSKSRVLKAINARHG
jgi:hypothetical protein